MNEWISVDEQLPEAGAYVDVWLEDMRQCDIEYDGGRFIEHSYSGCNDDTHHECEIDPSHWMPLPEPPKGDI